MDKFSNILLPHKERSGVSPIETMDSEQDLTDKIIPGNPAVRFNSGFEWARKKSSDKLESKLSKGLNFSKPKNVGILYEYASRRNADAKFIKNLGINKSDINKYKSYLGKLDDKLDEERGKVLLANLAAGVSGWTLGNLLRVLSDVGPLQTKEFKEYIRKNYPDLNLSFQRIDNSTGSAYSSARDLILHGDDSDILAHEVGHAKNQKLYRKLFGEKGGKRFGTAIYAELSDLIPYAGRIFGDLGRVPMAGLAALPFAHQKVLDKIDPGKKTKATKFVEDNPWSVGLAASGPKLYEEGSASARALKDIYKFEGKSLKAVGRGLAKLGPAFGTYAAAAAIPAGLGYLINRYSQASSKAKKRGKKVFSKKAEVVFEKISKEDKFLNRLTEMGNTERKLTAAGSGIIPVVGPFLHGVLTNKRGDRYHGFSQAVGSLSGSIGGLSLGAILAANDKLPKNNRLRSGALIGIPILGSMLGSMSNSTVAKKPKYLQK